mgnify:FL=1
MLALLNQGISAAESLQERLAGKSVEVKFEAREPVEVKVRSFNPYRRIVDEILKGDLTDSKSLILKLNTVNPNSTQEQLYLGAVLVLELVKKEIVDTIYRGAIDSLTNSKPTNALMESLKSVADYLDGVQLLSLRSFLGNEVDSSVNSERLGDWRYL